MPKITHFDKIVVDGIKVAYWYDIEDGRITEVKAMFWVGLTEYIIPISGCHIEEDIVCKIHTVVKEEVKLHNTYHVKSFYGNKSLFRRVINAILKVNN